jgi:predicted ATP-dependent endonuclease of OLD family
MHLATLTVRNLRSIEELILPLRKGLTTIVGANSSGKSNVFRALELFFTGKIDRRPFSAALDMPSWIMNATAPSARTSVMVDFDLSLGTASRLWKAVEDTFRQKGWPVSPEKRISIIRYFSRGAASGFQCIIPTKGTRQSECEEITGLADLLIRRVEYRYVPSLKDLQSTSFQEVSEELKARLLSVWAGGDRKDVGKKREAFQKIRQEIEQLIQDSAKGLSESLTANFPEVSFLKLAMASTELEDMIGSLEIFANDGHETLMRQKGSGIQGASIIHMLKILRDTAPKGANNKQLFLWNIEEPETFLHPSAQRRLALLLREQAKDTQILTTTHSPLFVDRRTPEANQLIQRKNISGHHCSIVAKLPREDPMKPIRESLGTSLADSLSVHEAVILVEGVSDVTIFSEAYRRLCAQGVLRLPVDYVAFISGHGSSQQATAYTILRSWSPLSKAVAVFDFDAAGREDGAKRLKGSGEGKDYFYLPHGADDVVLEDMYSSRIKDAAQSDGAIVKVITIQTRPGGHEISRKVEWNKELLAKYFVKNATSEEWNAIERFVKLVVASVVDIDV